MTWLLLDVGNSTLKWWLIPAHAAAQPQGAVGRGGPAAVATPLQGMLAIDTPALPPALAAALAGTFGKAAARSWASAPTACWGCAVAGADKVAAIESAIGAAVALPVQWLTATAQFDHDRVVVCNGYRDPAQLGPDRWHALIGARARFAPGPLLVVSAGTATTVDALGADGRFLGGVIAPGVELMRASLAHGTARLPLAAGAYVAHPDNTDDAIRTGILDAQIGLIAQRMRRLREQTGNDARTIVSGGNGSLLLGLLRAHAGLGTMALEPDLVLLGLWHRARAQTAAAGTDRTQ